jgi:hypothetical protein
MYIKAYGQGFRPLCLAYIKCCGLEQRSRYVFKSLWSCITQHGIGVNCSVSNFGETSHFNKISFAGINMYWSFCFCLPLGPILDSQELVTMPIILHWLIMDYVVPIVGIHCTQLRLDSTDPTVTVSPVQSSRGAACWSWTHDRKVVGSIPLAATFACNPEQVALLRLLSSFDRMRRKTEFPCTWCLCQWQAKDPILVRNVSSLWWTPPPWSEDWVTRPITPIGT